ncbi:hypothetical protein [Terriglobus aquaticus]|uniref:Uncharacterized protein n=2 Tax=Terriglobus aquaticus TaxID=940139 RepID=A0ABW9KN91_9BACT
MLAALTFAGCNSTATERSADESESAKLIGLLRSGDFQAIEQQMDASLRDGATEPTLAKMQALFPEGPPTSRKTIGYHSLRSGSQLNSEVITEYGFNDTTWVVTNVRIRKENAPVVVGFHATGLTRSLEETNRFTFAGKPFWNDCMAVLTLACGGLVLYAFVLCIRTPLRKKWRWLLFTLLGVCQLSFNWQTSQFGFRLFWIAIPPANASRVDYAPWYLFAGVPLGALIFLAKRRDLQLQAEAASRGLAN